MKVIILTKPAFNQLLAKIEELEKRFDLEPDHLRRDKLYSTNEVAALLAISRRTLQDYRDKGRIDHIKIGKTVRYRHCDLEKLLNNHRTPQKKSA